MIDEEAHYWGLLFVMVGPAGAGKNTIMNEVLNQLPDIHQLPTATTRPMRDTEVQGREHQFVSEAEFQQMDARHELFEKQIVHNHLYGTPRTTIENAIHEGRDLIADIDVVGATRLHNAYPHNTIRVFVQPPSVDALIKRMSIRGETQDEIDMRLQRVEMEMEYAPQCDYLITNYQDQLKQSSAILYGIILAERSRRALEQLRVKTSSLQNQAI
jgi:guanylate kinase